MATIGTVNAPTRPKCSVRIPSLVLQFGTLKLREIVSKGIWETVIWEPSFLVL